MRAWPRAAVRGAVGAAIAASLGAPGAALAQVRVTLDVGGASIRYADSVRVTATTFAPTVRVDGGPLTAVASGSLSAVGGGAWSSQGVIAASALSRPFGPGRMEFAAAGGGTLHQDGTRSGQYLGRVRLHAAGATHGLWLGGGAGRGWDGSSWRGSVEGDIGAWAQRNDLTVLGTVRPVSTTDSIRFTDLAVMLRRDAARVEVMASAGLRSGVAASRGSPNAWGSLSATMWVWPQVALVADGGSYPADINQGFPGGTYLSLALRVAPRRRAWMREQPLTTDPAAARLGGRAASSTRIEVVAFDAGRYTVRVRAPGARRVEIMGDFTEWRSTELVPTPNGWWSIVTRITPGVRQLTVRVDGGAWTVPAGATVETDEFGAPVGVVIVR